MSSESTETTSQLQCLQKGGPFQIVRVPKHTLAPDQVLIRQRVIAFNGLDCKQRDKGLFIERWPHVLGIEGAGVVEAVGSKVRNLQVGDEVTGWMAGRAHGQSWGGAYQEHVVMPERYVAKKPKNITIEQAASLTICYNTAICTFYILGLKIPIANVNDSSAAEKDRAPTSILILGGSSGIGANAIQLLRLAYPALPIFATSSPQHHARLLELGATKLFDYKSPSVVSDIKAASPESRGVDIIIDCVAAGATQLDICDALDPAGPRKYGEVVTSTTVPVPEGVNKKLCGGWALVDIPGGDHVIPALTGLIEEGKYQVPLPVKVVGHGLDQVQEVMDQVLSASGTKVLLTL